MRNKQLLTVLDLIIIPLNISDAPYLTIAHFDVAQHIITPLCAQPTPGLLYHTQLCAATLR